MSTYTWIESPAWQLQFFGLPTRIPWPSDALLPEASNGQFDMESLLRVRRPRDAVREAEELKLPCGSFDPGVVAHVLEMLVLKNRAASAARLLFLFLFLIPTRLGDGGE